MAWKSKNGATDAAFSEVNANPPKVLATTLAKYGPQRMKKQQIAIALSKAGKSKLPSPKLKSNRSI
jgi:hypothetical protein